MSTGPIQQLNLRTAQCEPCGFNQLIDLRDTRCAGNWRRDTRRAINHAIAMRAAVELSLSPIDRCCENRKAPLIQELLYTLSARALRQIGLGAVLTG